MDFGTEMVIAGRADRPLVAQERHRDRRVRGFAGGLGYLEQIPVEFTYNLRA